ncbi:MAG TPA: PQQ-binding-like beta-propeller repeat protein [Actinomycetota bacterium]|nr:PQQ-binding-like beta-propeller repeat protein [Actinomycetota bacterium]
MSRVLVLLLAASGLAAVPAAGAGTPDVVEPLSTTLSHVAVPAGSDPCAVRLTLPGERHLDAACEGEGDEEAATSDADGSGALSLEARSSLQTPRWQAALAPLDGSGSFVRVHGYGDVAAQDSKGRELWSRGSSSFFRDWGLDPFIVPFVLLGVSPLDPRTLASERPYAVGDLNGDGKDDVAVAHYVRQRDESNQTWATSTLTVLDGRDGSTLWARRYPGLLTQVVASAGGRLVVGQETGNVSTRPTGLDANGADGTTSTLHGLRFEPRGDALEAQTTWTRSTGRQWVRWLAAEPIGDGLVAASWMDKPFAQATGTHGHTLLVDAATGELRWQQANTGGYPRVLRHDASRDAVLIAELGQPYPPYRYDLVTIPLDGGASSRVTRADSILLSLTVADLSRDGAAEWVAGEAIVTTRPGTAPSITGGRVVALEGGGGVRWSRETRCPEDVPQLCGLATLPLTYGLHVDPGRSVVVDASFSGGRSRLRGLSAATGTVLWDRTSDPAYPLYLAPAAGHGRAAVLAATPGLIARAYDVATGATLMSAPVPFELHAVEAADITGDGRKEVLAGGEGGVVFAFDVGGPVPRVLWAAEAGRMVHKIAVTDLGGDGKREVVVAAASALAVFDLKGEPVASRTVEYPHPGDYVWTFALGDVSGDDRTDVVVPGRGLAAYDGRTGARLWQYAGTNPDIPAYFSEAVITPDRRVVSQWLTRSGVPFLNARSHQVVAALDGRTGQIAWTRVVPSKFGIVNLWRSVAIDPDHSCGPGATVAVTWDDSPGVVGWVSRTDFYDSQTGTLCFTSGPHAEQIVHMGTEHFPGTGMLQWNWYHVAHLRPGGVTATYYHPVNAATSEVAMADFGSLGKRFLRAWTRVHAYGAETPTGAAGNDPPEHARWEAFDTGRLLPADLDADGSDEVVAVGFDWRGYATVASFSSVGVFSSSFLPRGIAVLEAGPAS